MTQVRLGPGAEFDVIRGILADGVDPGPVLKVGPGDDAAVLSHGVRVLSTDLSIEGVHFRREWLEAREVGYRAAMAALSDLAAMGAAPTALLASIAGPEPDATSGFLAGVGQGVRLAGAEVGAVLAGGDVARSPGPALVDVVAVGDADDPWLRSSARPGDEVWVTGSLGAAAAAVRIWMDGGTPPPALRVRFARPTPRFSAAERLRESGLVTAAMDLSDGLVGDAAHLAAASGVRLRIRTGQVPVAPGVQEVLGREGALELALTGGEDYELLVTARPGLDRWIDVLRDSEGLALTRVGRVEEGRGVTWEGSVEGSPPRGFDHFAAGSDPGGPGS